MVLPYSVSLNIFGKVRGLAFSAPVNLLLRRRGGAEDKHENGASKTTNLINLKCPQTRVNTVKMEKPA